MKYCPNCGDEVEEGDAYCYECGEDLTNIGAETRESKEDEKPSEEEEVNTEEGDEELQDEDTEELTDLKAVGESKAEALRDAGYETVDDLREATQEEIAEVENIGEALSARIKSNADRAGKGKSSSGTSINPLGVFAVVALIALVVVSGMFFLEIGANLESSTSSDSPDTQEPETTDRSAGGNEESSESESSDTGTGESGDTTQPSSTDSGGQDSNNQDSRLQYGETYLSSTNIEVTVNEPEVIDSYSLSSVEYTPDEGNIFVQIDVTAKNNADEAHQLPWTTEFNLIAGNRQYETISSPRDEAYDSGSVQPGIVREGYILYEVPESTDVSDIKIVLSDEGVPSFEYDTRITWQ
jgi:predicted flap endonuclease-1-like 5' DNA nuclease